jgi:hypothetical protein
LILVDSLVWIDHLRVGADRLAAPRVAEELGLAAEPRA